MSKIKASAESSVFRKVINIFILFFIGLSILLLLLFGFTQTKTFRNLLKEQVILAVNDALYGKLSIGSIEGSILTSVKLNDVSLTLYGDTLASISKLNLRFNPIQLLFDRIDVKTFEIYNPRIFLRQDSLNVWNIEKLVKPTEEDTTTSQFPFSIQVNNLLISNLYFERKSFENRNNNEKLDSFNFDDFIVNDFNFNANTFINISDNEYFLELKEFNFNSNLNYFNLNGFKGIVGITDKKIVVNGFNIQTDSSNVKFDIKVDNFNLFAENFEASLNEADFTINLDANYFDFKDVKTFIPEFDLLFGKIELNLGISGKINDLDCNKLNFNYLNTKIVANGNIKNLLDINRIYVDFNVTNSNISESDITKLLPKFNIPNYDNLNFQKLDIKYVGSTEKVAIQLKSNINNGFLELKTDFDFTSPKPLYQIQFKTNNLDIEPFAKINTALNLSGNVQGSGISLEELSASLMVKGHETNYINGFKVDTLDLFVAGNEKKINANLSGYLNNAKLLFNGDLNFTEKENPSYNFGLDINDFNIAKFIKDSTQTNNSNINLKLNVSGKSFDLDSLIGKINLHLDESEFKDKMLMPADFTLSVDRTDSIRNVSLLSDVADFSFKGNYSLKHAVNILGYQAETIVNLIQDKIDEINPIGKTSLNKRITEKDTIPDFIKNKLKVDFIFKFNDFELISNLIGAEKLDILGSGRGTIYNDSSNFSITTNLDLDYFVNYIKGEIIYISGTNVNIKFNRDNQVLLFDNLFGSVYLNNKRIYAGSEIKNFTADMIFNQSKLIFNTNAAINGIINADLSGKLLMNKEVQNIVIEDVSFKYVDEIWSNNDDILIDLGNDYLRIKDLVINDGKTELNCKGTLKSNGDLDLDFNILNIDGEIFSKYFLGYFDKKLNTDFDLECSVHGNLENPIINATINGNELSYDTKKLGNLVSNFEYKDNNFLFDLRFFENNGGFLPTLSFSGNFPIYLGTKEVKSRILDDKPLSIKFNANKFNLNTIGNLLPFIVIKNGLLKSNAEISGTFNSVKYSGEILLNEGLFTLKNNNLDYSADMALKLGEKGIEIADCNISNYGGVNKKGNIKIKGDILLNNFNLDKVVAKLDGNLSVLSFASKTVLPIFYGDLFISSIGEWTFVYQNNKAVFLGNIGLEETNLVFSPQQNTYTTINNNFNYKFIVDSTKIDKEEEKFNKLFAAGKSNNQWQLKKAEGSGLEYSVRVKTLKDAKLVFILSEATNQKLTVESVGDINYEYKNGEIRAQGEFKLLTGSKLEFIKTFDAKGSIRFESNVTNPYLDIIATYKGTHTATNGTVEDVLVKLVLEGTVEDLGKNLAANPENISVYVGAKNIESGTPDNQLGPADAFSFVVLGKFVKDLTALDQTVIAAQTDMLLGSVLSSVASSLFGDAINNISLDQSMGYTKFSVSGRFSNFKYSIGGTTDIFKDVTGANLMIEYLFNPDFSIRLERKEPVVQTFGSEDKINELGLKYRFQF